MDGRGDIKLPAWAKVTRVARMRHLAQDGGYRKGRNVMDVRLDNRTAMITGASKGLGLAMAREFATSGANVAILARGAEALTEAQRIASDGASGEVATFQCDVSKAADIQATFDAVIKRFGKVDILINNAGCRAHAIGRDHRRRLAGRSGPEAVRGHPDDPAGVAWHETAQMGPDHQCAEHWGEGARANGAPLPCRARPAWR